MKAALDSLAPLAGSLDAVVWAGVGHGAELEAVRALGGRQWYIEPHPGLRRRIAARIGADGGASVLADPLWKTDGKGVFHLSNDAVSSTLLPPAEAWAGRPNVRMVQEIEVDTQSLATLLDALALGKRASWLLILDIGGGEDDLLLGCDEAVLRKLDQLLVPARCGRAAERLQELGYVRDAAGGDWWLLHPPAKAPRDLEDEIERVSTQLAERSAELEASTRALQEANEALQSMRQCQANLEEARDAALRERDEQAAAADALRGERDAESARATELQQNISALSQETAQTIAALEKERDAAIASLVEKTSQSERLEEARNQLQERAAKLEAELQEARRTAALSLKLQAQRDADLSDLQERYRESQDVQARQRVLLERLGERLGVASRYFHQLADERGKE